MPGKTNNDNSNVVIKENVKNIQPILDGEQAATASQNKFITDAAVTYDVSGSNVIRGGKFLDGPVFPAMELAGNSKMQANVDKNSSRLPYSDYCLGISYTMPTNDEIKGNFGKFNKILDNVIGNTFLVKCRMLEDIVYINHKMYDRTYVIDPADYTDSLDLVVEDMVNGSVDQYNKKSRRIAKLAKAIKNSILAQTNDTNPLYSVRLSEIYDRLTDYFKHVNRMVSTVYNLEGWLKLIDVFRFGTTVVGNRLQKFFNPDFQIRVKDKLGKLEAGLVGCYYDGESLLDYLDFTTVGYMNVQKGTPKVIAPTFFGARIDSSWDYNLANLLADTTKLNSSVNITTMQETILTTLDTQINDLYGGFFSYMQTALAPFNNIPSIQAIRYPGLRVKNRLINALACNTQIEIGEVCASYRIKVGGIVATDANDYDIVVTTPKWKANPADSPSESFSQQPWSPEYGDSSTMAKGAILNHNGFSEVSYITGTTEILGNSTFANCHPVWNLGLVDGVHRTCAIGTIGDVYSESDPYNVMRFNRLAKVPVKNLYDAISPVKNDGWYNNVTDGVLGYSGSVKSDAKYANTVKFKNDIFVTYLPMLHATPETSSGSTTTKEFTACAMLHRGDVAIDGNVSIANSEFWVGTSKGVLNYATGSSGLYNVDKPATISSYSAVKQVYPIIGINAYADRTSNGNVNLFSCVDDAIVPCTIGTSGDQSMEVLCEDKVTDSTVDWGSLPWLPYDLASYLGKQAVVFGFVVDRYINAQDSPASMWKSQRPFWDVSRLANCLIPEYIGVHEDMHLDSGKACYLNNVTD